MEMIGELRVPSRFTSRDRASHALVYSIGTWLEHGDAIKAAGKRNMCLGLEANPKWTLTSL